jgi:hypothetical protein
MKKLVLACLAVASASIAADSPSVLETKSYLNGNKLFEQCAGGNTFVDGHCYGYLIGVTDVAEALKIADVFVPDNASERQLVGVVKNI